MFYLNDLFLQKLFIHMKNLIIASTSTIYNGTYLEYLLPTLKEHFKNISTLLFIPYARPGGITHDQYTEKVRTAFATINIDVKGIHEYTNPVEAVQQAEGIFTGGGNTFLLVQQLYKNNVLNAVIDVVNNGTPYLGCSAGSNICGLTMETTNDMPIVYPPSFKTFGFVPFNLNPHYLDPIEGSTHMGETRETRINEFHAFNTQPVVGLREGSWLEVKGDRITLKGELDARIFEQNKEAYEVKTNTDLSHLN
ncbi:MULTISPECIES: dipeptidase PepE [Myroides]|uniref:(Alpha)-aspartyl dipeptidase n=1 Tax=Myroides odoratimimus TaxID=76832 RepID=A0AAI8G442_9FLAO|nr:MULTISPECIES: dipeptidase PepE [Myroides]ALU25326.1 (alpha)-aspartyl dipeptidase [Myroides odoratimimus]APA91331.1 dipeptidase E [Myroides sp. ZB35]MCA4806103.1 dipeptidase PepE [Myroides odoratimimus]MCO7723167.1 dipeptidase PepE [Myroides odoratimimus]MCS7472071.1 dipeptidase PepE [Myroides odoratimimus]